MEDNTVPQQYEPPLSDEKEHFKTKREIEKELIHLLQQQGYEYIDIQDEEHLKENLRSQLEKLNSLKQSREFKFSDAEWNWFFQEYFERKTIEEATHTIQKDYVKNLSQKDDKWSNIHLIDKENIHRNYLQVFKPSKERRDLVILVNGIPIVFLELKETWERLESSFRRLERYDRYEYLSGYFKLFWFVQLFVISNRSETKYFSNTSNLAWVKRSRGDRQENANFRLTSYWTDSKNNRIENLFDFTKHFFEKNTLLNILTKYCVFTTDKKLIVMRPYQISAVEAMVNRVKRGIEEKLEGSPESRGYIWHATGSGKTLTSYKARELISKVEGISKVLFVVDRKVLDSQTQREFHKFGDDDNTATFKTSELVQKLKDPSCKAITTTFQKLNKACRWEDFLELPVLKERVVFIFDECHRSQGSDGEMGHMRRITENRFKRSFIFGVSGTPIFGKKEDKEEDEKKEKNAKGTNKYFTECLSTYTLLDALQDNNVLAWRYDEAGFKNVENYELELDDPQSRRLRKSKIVDWVLENFERKTKGSAFKKYFNSLFVTDSIKDLLEYYEIFKEKIGDHLTMSAIFSISSEEEKNSQGNVDSLSRIIEDYNKTFGTDFDLRYELRKSYENWRENLTKKLREVKIDILIVVDMFLTGFDSAALNTLWIDKNIKELHELIQIFSRTNRIHSELKDKGNIVAFVPLRAKRDEALRIYVGGEVKFKQSHHLLLEKDFEELYAEGKEIIEEFMQNYPDEQINISEENAEDFVKQYNEALKMHKKLSCYSEYKDKELLTEEEKENYHAKYLESLATIEKIRTQPTVTVTGKAKTEIDNFALELIRSEDVDINYILRLIVKGEEKEKIMKKVISNTKMRECAPLIGEFIDRWKKRENNDSTAIDQEWSTYIEQKKDEELDDGIKENNFKAEKREDIKEVLNKEDRDKVLQGGWLRSVLPPLSYFNKEHYGVIQKAKDFLLNLMEKWKQYKI